MFQMTELLRAEFIVFLLNLIGAFIVGFITCMLCLSSHSKKLFHELQLSEQNDFVNKVNLSLMKDQLLIAGDKIVFMRKEIDETRQQLIDMALEQTENITISISLHQAKELLDALDRYTDQYPSVVTVYNTIKYLEHSIKSMETT